MPHIDVDFTDGVADLRGFNFTSAIAHPGGAEFYPGVLLPPNELDTAAPGIWDSSAKYNTVRVRMLVPENNYLIYGRSPDYASRIFINGVLTDTIGWIDEENENNNIYNVTQFRSMAQPENGVVEVVFHIAGIIRDTPAYYGLFIGEYETVETQLFHDTAYGLIPVIIFLTCALFYIGYFMFMPSIKTNLWFALIALIIGLFISQNWKIPFSLLPNIEYWLEFFWYHVFLLMICVCYSFFTRSLFKIPKEVPVVVGAFSILLTILLAVIPLHIAEQFLPVHTAFVFAVMVVNILLITLRIKNFQKEHAISFGGQIVFMLSGVFDMLGLRFLGFWDFSTFGMLIFLFTQMVAMYFVNNRAVENEQMLTVENASLGKLNAIKTELLGNISHEMKTPLTVISNMSQLTARHSTDDYIQGKMKIAVAEVERLKSKVGQLLKVARFDDADVHWDFEPTDVRKLINDTVHTCFHSLDEHNNKLAVELPETLPDIKADSNHLPGVIINLIENAVRFTRDGKITVRAVSDGDLVTVSVEDTGSGMTPEQKEHIFERFFVGDKSTGTGLGLYICKKIIVAHNGGISVLSEPGCGTTVSFTLPAIPKEGRL
ncbi:MAG: HAMP domain-containing histidine kinase [Oscillospiraceae bacterium]|nr:HAMP domain-containing histidine kinase [Oscillospiraceae bacterium]